MGARDLLCETLLQRWCNLHVSNVPPTSFCLAGAEGPSSRWLEVSSGQYSIRAMSLSSELCQQVCFYWLKIGIYYSFMSCLTHHFGYWYEPFIFKAFSHYRRVYQEVSLYKEYTKQEVLRCHLLYTSSPLMLYLSKNMCQVFIVLDVTATRKDSRGVDKHRPSPDLLSLFPSSAGSMWSSRFCKCRCNCRLRMRPVTSWYVSESISATPLYFDVIRCQSLYQCPSNQKIKRLVWQRVQML